MSVDRIFINCRVYTFDAANPRADAIAVRDGRIAGIGEAVSGRGLPETTGAVELLDLGGAVVVPGLIDSHNHLVHYGLTVTRSADLTGCESIEEILERLRAHSHANPEAAWLLGRRFDQELCPGARWPTREDLDTISPEVPTMISRVCMHAIVANTAALEPVRGRLSPEQLETGLLTEGASELVWSQVPSPSESELEEAALWAANEARRVGLAGVHCIIGSSRELDALRRLHEAGELPIRVRVQFPYEMADQLASEGLRTGSGDEWLVIGSAKLFMDGSMGARTAAMAKAFSDDPGNRGRLFMNHWNLAELLADLQSKGFQAAIHAIGDQAVECALKGIELAMPHGNQDNVLRHRIEHASQMSDDLVSEMARLRVPAAVQPQFIITDFWTRERVGRGRYRWCYPFKTMLDAGITLAMGSDCPVERLDPIELLDRAVNREPESAGERLSMEETLRAYSHGSAFAGLEEDAGGSLSVGKLADFAVFSEDPFAIEPSQVANLKVETSVVGGRLQ